MNGDIQPGTAIRYSLKFAPGMDSNTPGILRQAPVAYNEFALQRNVAANCSVKGLLLSTGWITGPFQTDCSDPAFKYPAEVFARGTRLEPPGEGSGNTPITLKVPFPKPSKTKVWAEAPKPAVQPSIKDRIFAKYEGAKPAARYDVVLSETFFGGYETVEEGFENDALAQFRKAGFNAVLSSGSWRSRYETAKASVDLYPALQGGTSSVIVYGCDGRTFERKIIDPIRGKRGNKYYKALTKRADKAVTQIRKDKGTLQAFLNSQPECPTFMLRRAYRDPYNSTRFLPDHVMARARSDDDLTAMRLGRYAYDSMSEGSVTVNAGQVSLRDYANYRILRSIAGWKDSPAASGGDWTGKKRAQTRTINRRGGNPKDKQFLSKRADFGASLLRGDPDLLEWSVEMGLLDAPTLLTKHQVRQDSPAFARLSSKGGRAKIDSAMLLNAYDTGNTRVIEQAIAARAPLRFTVAGKSHDLFARALIDGKFDLFSKMAKYWDVNRKIPFTDGGHTYLMHYMTPSVRRFDKIFRGQPR
ncbi:MAG: hypothetical protein V2I43_14215, partial [Parvularcula sp.]|nr:hypothetical protein [Parvularcula sp.]